MGYSIPWIPAFPASRMELWSCLSVPESLVMMLMFCCKEEMAQTGGLVCLLPRTWSLRLPRACLFLLHASVCCAVLTELSPASSSSSYPGSLFFTKREQGTEPEGQVIPQHRRKRTQLRASWHNISFLSRRTQFPYQAFPLNFGSISAQGVPCALGAGQDELN